MASPDPTALRYHGDQAVAPGMLDFAVNVRHRQPPPWLVRRLAARLPDLAGYPGDDDHRAAVQAIAARHGRDADEVLPLAGAAEGFALLPNLAPRHAALLAPSFTEPAVALAGAGVRLTQVVLAPPFTLAGAAVPEDADLVVVGNPTNPTAVVHRREQVLALRRPGRIVVVDEAFADAIGGEPGSLAAESLPDMVVLRSLTKTWALAGLRVGYALGAPSVLARLAARRAHWPVGTLQLVALAACSAPPRWPRPPSTPPNSRDCARRWPPGSPRWVRRWSTGRHRSCCSGCPRRPGCALAGCRRDRGATLRHVRRARRHLPAGGGAPAVAGVGRGDRAGAAVRGSRRRRNVP